MFFDDFSKYLEHLVICQEPLLITGDFNIHVETPEDSCSAKFLDVLESVGLKQHVNVPTHESGHTLDLIITRNCEDVVVDTPHATHFISDHAFVQCYLSCRRPTLEKKTISYRDLKKIDLDQFKVDLQLSPLGLKDLQSEGKNDLDQLVLLYRDTLSKLLDKHAPLKTRSFVVRPKLPWFNGSIKEAKKAKKRAEKKWRSSKNENDKEHFKSKRNEYLYLLNTAKQKYYSDKIEESQGDQRKLFKLVKSIMKPEETLSIQSLVLWKILLMNLMNTLSRRST